MTLHSLRNVQQWADTEGDASSMETTENSTGEVAETDTAPEQQEPEVRLTQADVDKLIKDRLSREKAKYADYDELKTKAAKFTELEDAQKTELQRAQENADRREKELEYLRTALKTSTVESVVTAAATRHGAVNPRQVLRLLDVEVELDDDGKVLTDVDAAVSEFLSLNTHLVSKTGTKIAPAPGVAQGRSDGQELTAEMLANIDPRELAMNPDLRAAYIKARDTWK